MGHDTYHICTKSLRCVILFQMKLGCQASWMVRKAECDKHDVLPMLDCCLSRPFVIECKQLKGGNTYREGKPSCGALLQNEHSGTLWKISRSRMRSSSSLFPVIPTMGLTAAGMFSQDGISYRRPRPSACPQICHATSSRKRKHIARPVPTYSGPQMAAETS